MWEENEYVIGGKVVGSIWRRKPNSRGYSTFPWGYIYNHSIGYVADSEQEARWQVERKASRFNL